MVNIIVAGILFVIATVFGTAGIVGLFIFPDAYTRLHAGSLASTTAVFTIFLACLFVVSDWHFLARIVVIMLFFVVSAPTGSHVVAQLLWCSGIIPWKQKRKESK